MTAPSPIVPVVHYYGRPVKLRRSRDFICTAAGLGNDVVPHTQRHTAANG